MVGSMPNTYAILADPQFQDVSPRSAYSSGKALALFSLFMGLCCTALWCVRSGQPLDVQQPINTMALPHLQSAKASQSLRALSGYRPQALPGRNVQDKLQQYGIGSSPLSELALTSVGVANRCGNGARDISVMANSMNKETKAMLSKVVVRAAANARDLPGISGPLGFFDPLGFSTNIPEGKLLFYREVELKHGRVCMLASLGILVAEKFHPLFGGNIDAPAYLAFQQTPLQNFWLAVLAALAIPEAFSVFTFEENVANAWMMKTDREPGDFNFDPLGIKPEDPKELNEMQTKELNNGRLAMIATAGMIAQELVSGQKIFS